MGLPASKLLQEIGGQTILERSVALLRGCPLIAVLALIARERDWPAFRAVCGPDAALNFIEGGATRQQSVSNGLRWLKARGFDRPDDFVLIHDAARCLASPQLVERLIRAAFDFKAVSAALPVVDTMVRGDSAQMAAAPVERSGLWAIQTPQVFSFGLIWAAHQRGVTDATDDASLVQPLQAVRLITGERANLKITTPEDLELARRLVVSQPAAAAAEVV